MNFTWGFILGLGMGFVGIIFFIAHPVVLEYLRQEAARKMDEFSDKDDERKLK